ncbi:MAG TPA: DUF6338 family protein [Anaerolineae bacterium]|nr:DUF6338 family protein [Anaerolineae bacterium]
MGISLDLQSIILLLFFIAPGFLFTRTYTAYRPRYYREAGAFEQIVLAIVGSTAIHGAFFTIIAIIVLLVWGISGGQIFSLTSTINFGTVPATYPVPVLAFLTFVGTLYLGFTLVAARRFATFLGDTTSNRPEWWISILGKDPPEPFLMWHTILQIEPYEFNLLPPHVHIQMRNGEYFEGSLYQMQLVGDEANTIEIALRNVYHSPKPPEPVEGEAGTPHQKLRLLPDQVVLLKSTDILWLTRSELPQ